MTRRNTAKVRRGLDWVILQAASIYQDICSEEGKGRQHGLTAANRQDIEAALAWLKDQSVRKR